MTFAELKETLAALRPNADPWDFVQHIPDSSDVYEETFHFGSDLILPSQVGERPWLGIVIEGRAEIYEASSYSVEFGAYRPIAVLSPGDTFGFFALADAILPQANPLPHKESWHISAGHTATLVAYTKLKKEEAARYPSDFCDDLRKTYLRKFRPSGTKDLSPHAQQFEKSFFPHMLLTSDAMEIEHNESCRVAYVAFPGISNIVDKPELSAWLFKKVASATIPYRLGHNIYSDTFYGELAAAVRSKVVVGKNNKIKLEVRNAIYPHFIEGIAQAIDAYVHDDPMFFSHDRGWNQVNCYVDGVERVIKSSDLLVADRRSQRPNCEALIPIGIANYHINQRMVAEEANRKKHSGFIENAGAFLYPKLDPAAFVLSGQYAEATINEYFRLYSTRMANAVTNTLPSKLQRLRDRLSVCTDCWGVGGRRVLVLKVAAGG